MAVLDQVKQELDKIIQVAEAEETKPLAAEDQLDLEVLE
jgi:hypothetical protein